MLPYTSWIREALSTQQNFFFLYLFIAQIQTYCWDRGRRKRCKPPSQPLALGFSCFFRVAVTWQVHQLHHAHCVCAYRVEKAPQNWGHLHLFQIQLNINGCVKPILAMWSSLWIEMGFPNTSTELEAVSDCIWLYLTGCHQCPQVPFSLSTVQPVWSIAGGSCGQRAGLSTWTF